MISDVTRNHIEDKVWKSFDKGDFVYRNSITLIGNIGCRYYDKVYTIMWNRQPINNSVYISIRNSIKISSIKFFHNENQKQLILKELIK